MVTSAWRWPPQAPQLLIPVCPHSLAAAATASRSPQPSGSHLNSGSHLKTAATSRLQPPTRPGHHNPMATTTPQPGDGSLNPCGHLNPAATDAWRSPQPGGSYLSPCGHLNPSGHLKPGHSHLSPSAHLCAGVPSAQQRPSQPPVATSTPAFPSAPRLPPPPHPHDGGAIGSARHFIPPSVRGSATSGPPPPPPSFPRHLSPFPLPAAALPQRPGSI